MKPPLLEYLFLNMRIPLGIVSVSFLFILYYLLFPDNSTVHTIKWTLIGDATLISLMAGGLTIKWLRWK